MKLNPGERLAGTGPPHQPGGYVVTSVVAETPHYGLYAGKKIFYNFDFTNKRLRETDEAEWLDVYLRTIRYPILDDAGYVRTRRAQARAEVRGVLHSRFSNLWPEPIDLLEVVNGHDAFPMPSASMAEESLGATEPIVVLARPHGQPLSAWRQNNVPIASVLSALAEILDFLRQAHAEGLVLPALHPGAFLVDSSHRVHYLGADPSLARDNGAAADGIHVVSQERSILTFTAPELFSEGTTPDCRCDLYSWGVLAYFLLSGQTPAQVGQHAERDKVQPVEFDFPRLENALGDIPASLCGEWAQQLGIASQALLARWPANFMHLFRDLLHPDPARRPASVEELLRWIDTPPPPPVNAILAVMVGPGEAKISFDLTGCDDKLDLVVRRGVSQPPRSPHEGTLLEQGPAHTAVLDPAVPLTPATVYYTAFMRRADSTGPLHSAGASCELLAATPSSLRQFAEAEARARESDSAFPPRLALCIQALDPVFVAEAFLASAVIRVRTWGLAALGQVFSRQPDAGLAENLLWEALRDQAPALQLEAARHLLAARNSTTDEFVIRIARAMARGDLDGALEWVIHLQQVGLDAEQARRLGDLLESERPLACPECQVQVPKRDRVGHLRTAHGYIEVAGSWMPRPAALERLWSQVLQDGAAEAHEQLLSILRITEQGVAQYVRCVEEELSRREHIFAAAGVNDLKVQVRMLAPYLKLLEQSPQMRSYLPEFLRSSHSMVLALGREAASAILTAELLGSPGQPRALRSALSRIAPNMLDEAILLCRRLSEAGIDVEAAAGCLKILERERLTACSECAAPVRIGDLETHLRRAHGIFEFRGQRGPYRQTRALVLDAVFGPPADIEAWQTLSDLARDRYGHEADKHVVTWICQRLIQLRRRRRAAAMAALAGLLAGDEAAGRLLPLLVRRWTEPAVRILARLLALEIVSCRPGAVAPEVIVMVMPLLSARELPNLARLRAAEALLKTTGKSGAKATEVLLAFVGQAGKLRAIDKLRQLEKRVGQAPAIDLLCARLEDQVRMDCPSCGAQLRRIDMVRHLWEGHRLILEGRRVREPWRVIEDWVVDYRLEKDPVLLERCRDLARKMDDQRGLERLQRLLLRHGVEDPEALRKYLQSAREQEAAVCPHCFELTPFPQSTPPVLLTLSDEILQGHGFRLQLTREGLFSKFVVERPDEHNAESAPLSGGFTWLGRFLLLAAPLTLLPFALLLWAFGLGWPLVLALTVTLGVGFVLLGVFLSLWPSSLPGRDRLIDAAWTKVVPSLAEAEWTEQGGAFLGGLARSSLGRGRAAKREGMVKLALTFLESTRLQTPRILPLLAALHRLAAEDQAQLGEDGVTYLAEQAARTFHDGLPLAFTEVLLGDLFGEASESAHASWSRGRLRRLQALLIERAIASGLEAADLVEMARVAPTFGAALGCNDLDRLAKMRLVWSMCGDQPWRRLGATATVFDLAHDVEEGEVALEAQADLLLVSRQSGVVVGSDGVWFKDACFTTLPRQVEVISRRLYNEDGFDLIAGQHRFWFAQDPTDLADQLQQWLLFYFRDFAPKLAGEKQGSVTEAGRRLFASNVLSCPRCRREFVPGVGRLGLQSLAVL